jgi:cation diffusion facilitator CzcD-associated flavoprotein CzcO
MTETERKMSICEVHDAIIIGAGLTGIFMSHRLREQGLDVTVLERGEDLGGTWYWNRYPGARFDSESYSYGFSFSREIYDEWNWSEHFAAQPETLRYLNFVADKLDARDCMQFNCNVKAARFDETHNLWRVELTDGRTFSARLLFTAIGMLSAPTMPRIDGVDTFKGEAFHTYYWPKDRKVELANKRVAVIGTGATGVQVISDIASEVGSLTVFQRRPNWCAPLHNAPIDEETQKKLKASYDQIFAKVQSTHGGFLHSTADKSYYDVAPEDRQAFWEEIYASPGFQVWVGNYAESSFDPAVNAEYSEFIAGKIRSRVTDQAVAEKLIPKDHGFGSRRVPLETRYYEAYNQDNVRLVDVNDTPIECITETGIRTSAEAHEFDLIIYATGFDAITGSFDRIDIEGRDGIKLADKWKDGPVTYLGLQVAGFPNLFTLAGPQSASVASNFPPAIEAIVEWTSNMVREMTTRGVKRVETTEAAEEEWAGHVKKGYEGLLLAKTHSWFTGYNSNVEGHDTLRHMIYLGGAPAYRAKLADVAERDYAGFEVD